MAALLVGCAGPTPRTEVMLDIDAEPAVRERAAQLRVHVLGGEAGQPPEGYASRLDRTFAASWPRRVALVPLELEPPRGWQVELEAQSATGEVVAASVVRGGYDEARTVLVRAVLEDACIGVPCPRMRCAAGRCIDPLVDVSAAPDLEE